MKETTTIPVLIRRWLNGIFLVLFMGVLATPAVAILSDKTGQIQGQAPTVTGRLQVLSPDGESVVADNAILGGNQIPNQFVVSSSTADLVLQDTDDDSGLSAWVDTDHATLSWKHDGTEMTSAQLAAPLGNNFAGQTVTLEVSAAVTVSSVTGLPTTAAPQTLTSSYTLNVPLPVLIQDDFTVTSGAMADGVDSNVLSAIVKDAHGNLLSGVNVAFNVTSGEATPATQTVKTNDSGVAQASLVSLVVGGNQVTATVGTHTTAAKTSSFVAGTVERSTSRLEASPVQLVANGIATSTLTFTAKDINENPVLGQVVTFGLSGATEGVVVGTTTDHNDGTYSAILKVGTKAGTVIVVPKVNDVQVGNGGSYNSRTLTFIADESTPNIDGVDFSVASGAVADGTASNALNAIVKDAHGNLLSGVDVTFNVTSGEATPATQTVKTNESGMAQATLVSTVAGDNQVAAAVGSQSTTVKTSIFVADERTAIIDSVDFSVASGAVADGTASNALNAIVKDAHGNLLSGVDVTFNVTSGEATPATQTVKTNESGMAQAALVSTVVGDNQVTVTSLGSTPAAKTSSFVGVTLKLTADRQTITADGSDIVTYTAEVVDANDKPVKGVSVHWTTSVNSLSHNSSITNESGYAMATLSGTNIGQARVTASVGKDSMSVDVEFTDKIQESWIINSTSSTHSAKPIYGVGIDYVGYGFIIIPPIIGPTSLSGASFDPDIVTVPLSNETGQQYMVKFRGYRSNACSTRAMSSSVACSGSIGSSMRLRLDYKVEDNGHLPAGFYDGVINLQGIGTAGNNRIDVSINVQLTVKADSLTAGIAEADFVVVKNNASADGVESNTVKAVVRDINGTPVPNAEVTFTADNGANIAATGTTGSDGSVTVDLTSTTAGSAKVTASVNDSSQSVETTFIADVLIKHVLALNKQFANDAGFPTTGFTGAEFTLALNSGSASDYIWTSDASWVSVSDGVVSFTGTGNGNKVTIRGTPKNGDSHVIIYDFTLSYWFINNGSALGNLNTAEEFCSNQPEYSLPPSQLLSEGTYPTARGVGTIWGEWGSLDEYSAAGFIKTYYWSSTSVEVGGANTFVSMSTGSAARSTNTVSSIATMCYRTL